MERGNIDGREEFSSCNSQATLAYCVKYFTQRKIRRKTITNGERKKGQRETAKRICIFHVTVSVTPVDYKKELVVSFKALPRVNIILPVFIEGQTASRGNIRSPRKNFQSVEQLLCVKFMRSLMYFVYTKRDPSEICLSFG